MRRSPLPSSLQPLQASAGERPLSCIFPLPSPSPRRQLAVVMRVQPAAPAARAPPAAWPFCAQPRRRPWRALGVRAGAAGMRGLARATDARRAASGREHGGRHCRWMLPAGACHASLRCWVQPPFAARRRQGAVPERPRPRSSCTSPCRYGQAGRSAARAAADPARLNFIRAKRHVRVKMAFERDGITRTVEARQTDAGWSATVREDNRVMANMTYKAQTEVEMKASFKRSMSASGFREVSL